MDYVCGIMRGLRDKLDVQRGLRGASADITWTLRGQPAGFTRAPYVVREYRVGNVECTVCYVMSPRERVMLYYKVLISYCRDGHEYRHRCSRRKGLLPSFD
jgi:hypothetical protein